MFELSGKWNSDNSADSAVLFQLTIIFRSSKLFRCMTASTMLSYDTSRSMSPTPASIKETLTMVERSATMGRCFLT